MSVEFKPNSLWIQAAEIFALVCFVRFLFHLFGWAT